MFTKLLSYDVALSKAAIAFISDHPNIRVLLHLGVDVAEAKGLIHVLVFWALWFRPHIHQQTQRFRLIAVLYVATIALAIGRLCAQSLPFRFRPIASVEIMADNVRLHAPLSDWSAMPSDHAVMFFALATGIALVSRTAGLFLLLHAFLVIGASRILAGLHFTSDIVVGALIGSVMALCFVPITQMSLQRLSRRWPETYAWVTRPDIGYVILIFVSFQFATMFDGIRHVGVALATLAFGH